MAEYSASIYTGDGANTTFNITFPYVDVSQIVVKVDDVEVTPADISNNIVTLSTAPALNSTVSLRRVTDISAAVVDYQDEALLTESDLDRQTLQLLHAVQEVDDKSSRSLEASDDGSYDFGGNRLKNVALPVDDTDVATKAHVADVFSNSPTVSPITTSLNTLNTEMDAAEANIATNAASITAIDGRVTTLETNSASYVSTTDLNTGLAGKADTSGTYASLRAQATTADDVGLGNVNNFNASSSTVSDSNSTFATSRAVNNVRLVTAYGAEYGGVGQLAFLARISGTGFANGDIAAGSTYSGSQLTPAGVRVNVGAGTAAGSVGFTTDRMSGTWRALGRAITNGDGNTPATTLFVRIA